MKTFWILFKFSGHCPGFTALVQASTVAEGVDSLGLTMAEVEEWREVSNPHA
jgi:hypothetical protein